MIALPTFFCPKLWENMTGGETERFCTKCQRTVHNIESLSLDERLALLGSPKSSHCGRYRIAVRRARPGQEQSYMKHLLRYGAGVAASSAVVITLWQLYDDNQRNTRGPTFRVGSPSTIQACGGMPDDFYEEQEGLTLGMIAMPRPPQAAVEAVVPGRAQFDHVDISLESVELEKLLKPSERPKPEFTALPSPPSQKATRLSR